MTSEVKAWIEVLLRVDTDKPPDVADVTSIISGDLAGYFPSLMACPLHEITDLFVGDRMHSVVSLMDATVPWLMTPGILAERPLNLGDMVHLCVMEHQGVTRRFTTLNVLLLSASRAPEGPFNTVIFSKLPDTALLSFVMPQHVSYVGKVQE